MERANPYAEPLFRGWAKPGPIPPGVRRSTTEVADGETLDAISGYFRLYQLRKGHRFSTDDVLVAWYGTAWAPCAQTVLDLGSGIGAVAMIAAWRLPGARFTTIEVQPESVALARKSARYNGLTERFTIREGDFRDTTALTAEERFDLVLGSPPYFPPGSGVLGDHPQKIACRFEMRGSVVDYCALAAQHLAAGGLFACVFPTEQLPRFQHAARTAGLSIIRQRPVFLREGEAPLLTLFAMMRAIDLPPSFRHQTWKEPPLIIRTRNGRVHSEYATIKLTIGFPP